MIWANIVAVREEHYDEIEEAMTSQKRMEFLKLKLTEELVAILVEETGCRVEEAFAQLYRSQTYAKLSDPNTKLYIQSAGYIYSLLEEELAKKNIN